MYPILFESTEKDFTTNGLGRLKDAISCSVVEERNGTYELSMVYPISGIHYDLLENDRIIYAMPADGKSPQPFRIYKISRPISGKVTVSAEHISYLLASAVVMPFTASSCAAAIAKLNSSVIGANGFTFWTDKAVTGTYTLDKPTEVRTVLGGSSGSLLDTYGKGEYEFDGFNVKLYLNRGVDNGVTIRYGKNLTDLTADTDMTNVYTGIVPYATTQDSDGNEITVTLSENVVKSSHTGDYAYPLYKVVDFSQNGDSEETMTESELRTLATNYVNNNNGWEVENSLTVSFVALWQTDEYKNVAALERVNLCDTVHVVYTDLGVNTTAKVVKTDFDVLNERYNSIELGENSSSLSKTLSEAINSSTDALADEVSGLPAAITKATKKLAGGLGGYVVLSQNANGEPEEILIMDTNDKNTAQNVIRMNKNGIGFSTTGYQGPFANAWTIDGKLVADYITTGTLNADLIKAGTIADTAGNTSWNLASGALTSKRFSLASDNLDISEDGTVAVKNGAFTVADSNGGTQISIHKGSSGWGVYAPTLDGAEAYFNGGGGSSSAGYRVYINRSIDRNVWGVSLAQLNFFSTTKGAYCGYLYGDGENKITMVCGVDKDGDGSPDGTFYFIGQFEDHSDRRFKHDIEDITEDDAVEFVRHLRPRAYIFNGTRNRQSYGFIAQEVLEHLPQRGGLVDEAEVDNQSGVPQGRYLFLAYQDIIPFLTKTIQSQDKRITDLEERLAKIEEALNADN